MLRILLQHTDAGAYTVANVRTDITADRAAPDVRTDVRTDAIAERDTANTAAADVFADAQSHAYAAVNAQRAARSCDGWFGRCGRDDRFVRVDLAALPQLIRALCYKNPPLDSLLLVLTMTRV